MRVRRAATSRKDIRKQRPAIWVAHQFLFQKRGLVPLSAVRRMLFPELSHKKLSELIRKARVNAVSVVIPGRLRKRTMAIHVNALNDLLAAFYRGRPGQQNSHKPMQATHVSDVSNVVPFICGTPPPHAEGTARRAHERRASNASNGEEV